MKFVKVKDFAIGDGYVTIQSMTKTDTRNIEATVAQILELKDAGCDIIRMAVPDETAANALFEIRKRVPEVALVADIHFDYKLALTAAEAGIDKIRINPGNMREAKHVQAVANVCKAKNIAIRIGVNSGSVVGEPTPENLVNSGLVQAEILEKFDFSSIILSFKVSNVRDTVEVNRLARKRCDYPLHIGVTETGSDGVIKSAVGIGALLLDGIGDTIRVSLTAEPIEEVKAALSILRSVGLRQDYVNIIACPTCGRCKVDVIDIANKVEKATKNIKKAMTVAIMGCAVNGPGEARHADIGIAGGDNEFVLFEKGVIIGKIPAEISQKVLMERLCNE